MSTWLHLPLHRRWFNRNYPSQLIIGHCPPRHILRSCPLPLCSLYRCSICNYRGFRALVPFIYRLHTSYNLNQGSFWYYVCRSKFNFFPTTFSRPCRHATALLRLPGCLYIMEHNFIYGLLSIPSRCSSFPIHHLRSFCH